MTAVLKVSTLLVLSLALALTDPGLAGRDNTPRAPQPGPAGERLEPSVAAADTGSSSCIS